MSIDPGGDALTIAFADLRQQLAGVARLGVSEHGASGLLLLFHRGDTAAVSADGAVALPEAPQAWDDVSAAGIDVTETTLHWAGDDGALDLRLEPAGPPAEVSGGTEQPLRITGTATVGGARLTFDGRGQRTRSSFAPDWERTELARTLQVWLADGRTVTVTALRERGRAHGEERLEAVIVDGEAVTPVPDPRLSTTYDGEGRQRHAGLELWLSDDGPVHRLAGEAVAGTTLDLGRLKLDTAFFAWRSAGALDAGRYDVLRRAS
jgi:hypothetical protein